MRCLKSFGERVAARDLDRQTADIHILLEHDFSPDDLNRQFIRAFNRKTNPMPRIHMTTNKGIHHLINEVARVLHLDKRLRQCLEIC